MTTVTLLLLRLHLLLRLRLALPGGRRDGRGDVPGWVLVTVMTAGLVVALSAVARDQLTALLRDALNSVK
ncbi:hypothetical protein [Nocardioides kribbensis]|uniref:hypothetical protein n=1 Tax=Nocardioides kribbensis TaxID=305517 RepID=UPI0032DAAE6F